MFQEQTEGNVIYKYGDDQMMSQLRSYGNIIEDPNQTIDLKTRGFKLPADSPALEQGFKQIPFGQIGIQKDKYSIEVSK